MTEAATKGAGFNSTIATIKAMIGAPAFAKYVESLVPATRALVETPPLAVTWLPIQHWMEMMDNAHRVAFAGDVNLVKTLGQRSVTDDLNRLYRFAIRLATPVFVVERTASLWQSYTRNNGRVVATFADERTAKVRYVDVAAAEIDAFWPFQCGAIHAVLELTGRKAVATQHEIENAFSGVMTATWA